MCFFFCLCVFLDRSCVFSIFLGVFLDRSCVFFHSGKEKVLQNIAAGEVNMVFTCGKISKQVCSSCQRASASVEQKKKLAYGNSILGHSHSFACRSNSGSHQNILFTCLHKEHVCSCGRLKVIWSFDFGPTRFCLKDIP